MVGGFSLDYVLSWSMFCSRNFIATVGRPDEIDAFNKLISNFETINPDIQVKLKEYSWDDHRKTLDVRLAGGKSLIFIVPFIPLLADI